MPHHMHGPHGHFHDKPPHEEIFERLDRLEETLKRIEEKIR